MPIRSNRICNKINCNRVIEGTRSRCKEHESKPFEHLNKIRSSGMDDNTTFYNSRRWRKTSKLFLSLNPICVECGNLAKHSDHIKRIADGGDPYSFTNLQALCISCHSSKTAKEIRNKGGGCNT